MGTNNTEKGALINIIRYCELDPPINLFHNKTKAYRERYRSWSIRFLEQPYFKDTVEHKMTLFTSLLSVERLDEKQIEFLRGCLFASRSLYKDIQSVSLSNLKTDDVDIVPQTLQDLLNNYYKNE